MATSQAIDGRKALVWYLEPGAEVTGNGTTALAKGDIVVITAQGDDSAFPEKMVNKPFIATTDTVKPKASDKYKKLKPYFIGMATDKSLNKSKNTQDVTVDADAMTNNICDGIVSTSGSLSMVYTVDGKGYASTFIKQRFGAVDVYGDNGAVETLQAATDEKDILLFVWNAREAKANELIEFEVLPVLITSLNHSSSYGSSQSMDVDFTGNAADENGYEARTMMIPNGKEIISVLSTNRAGMDKDSTAA